MPAIPCITCSHPSKPQAYNDGASCSSVPWWPLPSCNLWPWPFYCQLPWAGHAYRDCSRLVPEVCAWLNSSTSAWITEYHLGVRHYLQTLMLWTCPAVTPIPMNYWGCLLMMNYGMNMVWTRISLYAVILHLPWVLCSIMMYCSHLLMIFDVLTFTSLSHLIYFISSSKEPSRITLLHGLRNTSI